MPSNIKDYKDMIKKINQRMQACIQLEIQHPTWNAQKLADELGLHYQTVWHWQHDEVYIAERDKQLKQAWNWAMKIAQKTMIDLARQGDRQAAEYILTSGGYKGEQTINLNTNTIKVTLDD